MKLKNILSILLIVIFSLSTFLLYIDRIKLNSEVSQKKEEIQRLNVHLDSLKQEVQNLSVEVEMNKNEAIVKAQQLQEVLLKQSR